MTIDCTITEKLKEDFSALWKCEQRGDTLEIQTPYLMPDSKLLTLMVKVVGERCIVCDGGIVWDTISAYSSLPLDEITPALQAMAGKFRIKQGDLRGSPLYFKECDNLELVSSLAFDMANFSVMATGALVTASSDEIGLQSAERFEKKADDYLHTVKPEGFSFLSREISEVPGFRFGAVLERASHIWLVSYVTGSNHTYFRRSLCDTAMSFRIAWHSPIGGRIKKTIPVVNTDATGYDEPKLVGHFAELRDDSHGDIVKWSDKSALAALLQSPA